MLGHNLDQRRTDDHTVRRLGDGLRLLRRANAEAHRDWQVRRCLEPGHGLFDKLVNGAPPMAPLLFPNLVGLALIGLWALIPHLEEAGSGSSWLGSTYQWAHPQEPEGAAE